MSQIKRHCAYVLCLLSALEVKFCYKTGNGRQYVLDVSKNDIGRFVIKHSVNVSHVTTNERTNKNGDQN